jgi:DNA methylase
LFRAHWYPTKISPETVALMIACHTRPGDLVFDGFGGSCTTAVAALLCSKPSAELSALAQARGLKPIWGARRAVVYELAGLGSFIGQTLCSQPDPARFAAAATRVLAGPLITFSPTRHLAGTSPTARSTSSAKPGRTEHSRPRRSDDQSRVISARFVCLESSTISRGRFSTVIRRF